MSSLSGSPLAFGQDLFTDSTVQTIVIGARAETSDGRVFRYAAVGTSAALVAGSLYQSPANIGNHQRLTVQAAAAVGATTVSVTLGATAVTANQYAGGFLVIHSTGAGYSYRIAKHPAAALSATLTVTLEDPVQVALTTSSVASLVYNPFGSTNGSHGVIVNPTTPTGAPVGWAVKPCATTDYGWLQTHGPTPALVQGTIAIGSAISPSVTTAGAVASCAGTNPVIGYTLESGTSTENCAIYATID